MSDDASVDQPTRYVKPSGEELRRRLTPMQYRVTRKEGADRPFDNPDWDEKCDRLLW